MARSSCPHVANHGPLRGPGPEQGGLPDAGLPFDDHDLGRAVAGPRGHRVQEGQFVMAADQAGREAGRRRQRGELAAQDRGVQGDGLG